MTHSKPLPGTDFVGYYTYWIKGKEPIPQGPLQPFSQQSVELISLPGITDSPAIYERPENYRLNNSPTPTATDEVKVFNSWSDLIQDNSLGIGLALPGYGLGLGLQQRRQFQKKEESYYAVLNSYTPLYELYVDRPSISLPSIPIPFSPDAEQDYLELFSKYGTHYVRRATVGGQLVLFISMSKDTNITVAKMEIGLNSLLSLIQGVSLDVQTKTALNNLTQTLSCKVSSRGGDPTQIRTLNISDLTTFSENFNTWRHSIAANPEVLDYQQEGIWTLVEDRDQRQALENAYNYFCKIPDYRVTVLLQNGDSRSEVNDSWAGTRGESTPLAGFQLDFTSHQQLIDFEYSGDFSDSKQVGPFPQPSGERFCGNNQSTTSPPSENAGTRLQRISIKLKGPWADKYDVYYQAHVSFRGDTKETYCNGDWCGREPQYEVTDHLKLPANIEAIRVWLEHKNS